MLLHYIPENIARRYTLLYICDLYATLKQGLYIRYEMNALVTNLIIYKCHSISLQCLLQGFCKNWHRLHLNFVRRLYRYSDDKISHTIGRLGLNHQEEIHSIANSSLSHSHHRGWPTFSASPPKSLAFTLNEFRKAGASRSAKFTSMARA